MYSSDHPGPGLDLPNPVGLIVSRDSGETWQPVSLTGEADFHAMAVSPADPNLILGLSGRLHRSEDQRRTWKQLQPEALMGPNRGPFQLTARPTERSVLLAATGEGLLRTADAGATWDPLVAGSVSAASYVPGKPERILIYHVEQGLMESRDAGRNWRSLKHPVAAEDAGSFVTIHPTDPDIMYLGTFKADIFRTRDGGQSWEVLADTGKVVALCNPYTVRLAGIS